MPCVRGFVDKTVGRLDEARSHGSLVLHNDVASDLVIVRGVEGLKPVGRQELSPANISSAKHGGSCAEKAHGRSSKSH